MRPLRPAKNAICCLHTLVLVEAKQTSYNMLISEFQSWWYLDFVGFGQLFSPVSILYAELR